MIHKTILVNTSESTNIAFPVGNFMFWALWLGFFGYRWQKHNLNHLAKVSRLVPMTKVHEDNGGRPQRWLKPETLWQLYFILWLLYKVGMMNVHILLDQIGKGPLLITVRKKISQKRWIKCPMGIICGHSRINLYIGKWTLVLPPWVSSPSH